MADIEFGNVVVNNGEDTLVLRDRNAENNIGSLSNLTTTAKNNLVTAINEVDAQEDTNASELKCLVLSKAAFSSLPQTFTDSRITTDMVCLKAELSTPSAQTGDWTVNTDTAGQAVVSGSISGSTTLKIYLVHSR